MTKTGPPVDAEEERMQICQAENPHQSGMFSGFT